MQMDLDMNKIRFIIAFSLWNSVWYGLGAVVNTTYGPVLGDELITKYGTLHRYRGIPYAEPPVKELRFQYPRPPRNWTEELDASQPSDQTRCAQLAIGLDLVLGSEDCLVLNVYTPAGNDSELAVMVWIHGGMFTSGSTQYVGEMLAIMENVVVVTFNYRLGILGFFTDGTDVTPGNAGIADQILALQWIRENIGSFGGNPTKVTIFGQDAGSMSVNLLLVSPMSSQLFKRGISQSGTLTGAKLDTDAERAESYKELTATFDCVKGDNDTTITLADCLRNISVTELFYHSQHILKTYKDSYITIANPVLPQHPDAYFEMQQLNAVEYMIGLNSDDGDFFYALETETDMLKEYFRNGTGPNEPYFNKLVDLSIDRFSKAAGIDKIDISNVVLDQYTEEISDPIANMRALLDMTRDSYFLSGTMTCLRSVLSTNSSQAFLYYFDVNFPYNDTLPANQNLPSSPELHLGAGHSSEIPYVMGWLHDTDYSPYAFMMTSFADKDKILSASIMRAWASFAKTGQPVYLTLGGEEQEWPAYETQRENYLHLNNQITSKSVRSRLLSQGDSFWNKLLPSYISATSSKDPDTAASHVCPTEEPETTEDVTSGLQIISTNDSATTIKSIPTTLNIEETSTKALQTLADFTSDANLSSPEKNGTVVATISPTDSRKSNESSGSEKDGITLFLDRNPSKIDRDAAETGLFILIMALLVLLIAFLILLVEYCSLRRQLRANNVPKVVKTDLAQSRETTA